MAESVPLIVRGVDLLGHPFEERTATLTLNLQGCRYFSKHHLPRNSWISVEVANGGEPRSVRARVAWIHRPHSIRDLFQIAVELEGAANIWGLESSPDDWQAFPSAAEYAIAGRTQTEQSRFFDVAEIPSEGKTIPMNSYSGDSLSSFDQSAMANPMNHAPAASDTNSAVWRDQLASDMAVAQRQWDELLQSSIDRSLQRLAEELPGRAQEAVRATEDKMAQQFANLSQMLAQMSSEAQNALAGVKGSIEQEVGRAREAIENTRQQMLDRVAAEAEARVAPHAARVPELVRELSGREEQTSESLHLHRERLRHASDNTMREISAHAEATAAAVRRDFEAARTEALSKWNEELDGLSTRAAHSAGESLSRTSEWLQQETRERLQVLSEQTLATATARFEEETTKAAGLFATHLEGQSIFHLAQVHQQLDGVADDLTGRARTQLAEAAEAAAASFGTVLHNLSAESAEQFSQTSQASLDAKRQELENYTRQVHAAFETESVSAIQGIRDKADTHLQSAVAEARATLAAESAAAIDAHRSQYAVHAQEWSERLNRVAEDAIAQGAGRIETAADMSTVAAVRRLNEHGQNVIESLMRSADQALRDSASKMFEGLAVALREQDANASSAAAANFAGGNAPANQ
ncbi:MAG TPA: hypothetical protein VJS43_18770 [Candidatus Acidoferrales bacterium]|nr:hypothetical protein [Candidatus Acidoferrales bacterium]